MSTPKESAAQPDPQDIPAADLREEYEDLVERVRAARTAYYQRDAPEISDAEYDALYRRLEDLEALGVFARCRDDARGDRVDAVERAREDQIVIGRELRLAVRAVWVRKVFRLEHEAAGLVNDPQGRHRGRSITCGCHVKKKAQKETQRSCRR